MFRQRVRQSTAAVVPDSQTSSHSNMITTAQLQRVVLICNILDQLVYHIENNLICRLWPYLNPKYKLPIDFPKQSRAITSASLYNRLCNSCKWLSGGSMQRLQYDVASLPGGGPSAPQHYSARLLHRLPWCPNLGTYKWKPAMGAAQWVRLPSSR